MPPEYVRPCVKAQQNDERDVEAIVEAAMRPTMRVVAVKSEAQSDMQSLHRVRARLVAERTALINHLRPVLLEPGITVAQGRRKLERALPGCVSASAFAPRTSARSISRLKNNRIYKPFRAMTLPIGGHCSVLIHGHTVESSDHSPILWPSVRREV